MCAHSDACVLQVLLFVKESMEWTSFLFQLVFIAELLFVEFEMILNLILLHSVGKAGLEKHLKLSDPVAIEQIVFVEEQVTD